MTSERYNSRLGGTNLKFAREREGQKSEKGGNQIEAAAGAPPLVRVAPLVLVYLMEHSNTHGWKVENPTIKLHGYRTCSVPACFDKINRM